MPLDVQCSGVSWPIQLWVATVDGPRAWSTLTAKCSCSTATLIVSPSSAASRMHTSAALPDHVEPV